MSWALPVWSQGSHLDAQRKDMGLEAYLTYIWDARSHEQAARNSIRRQLFSTRREFVEAA